MSALYSSRSSALKQILPLLLSMSRLLASVRKQTSLVGGLERNSSIHLQRTTDTFGLSSFKSIRGVPRRGPRPKPYDREPSGMGASIASMSHQNTGSHGTSGISHNISGSWSQNDCRASAFDYDCGIADLPHQYLRNQN